MKIFNIVALTLFIGLIIAPAPVQGALLTSSASPSSIFKCGVSNITATFSDAGILGVTATLSSQKLVQPGWQANSNVLTSESTTITLADNGTHWVGQFGNNEDLLWGFRVITFSVNTGAITSYSSPTRVFVYSDVCTGTDVTSFTGVSVGLGRYTNMLYNGNFTFIGTSLERSIIGWALYPWIEYWGYAFYVIILLLICSVLYLKTQNVTQPLAVAVFLLLIFSTNFYVPVIYRQWIVFVLALGITAIYYRLFVRD